MSPLPFNETFFLSVYYNTLLVIVLISTNWCLVKNRNDFLEDRTPTTYFSYILPILLSVSFIVFWGLRGHRGFGDTGYYVYSYENLYEEFVLPSFNNEWLWNNSSHFLASLGVSTTNYLIIIEAMYIGSMFFCCYKLMRDNLWIALLFFIGSLSFLSYGINGIRNGLACNLILMSISLLTDSSTLIKSLGIILLLLTTGIHASAAIPVICCLIAYYLIKNVKVTFYIWGASIFISLIAGDSISSFFANLGFDDRASKYLIDAIDSPSAELFSSTGFRWDFLLYSMVPIILIYYLKMVRNFEDKTFDFISKTYILANAFWILVIRASFSNRFAYLSWFMLPLVIAYPLLRFNISKNQWAIIGLALFLNFGFTYFMYFIGK